VAAPRGVRVAVRGRVQGVWFRGWTVSNASGLGLDGWVRNRSDGSVEAVFAGPAEAVEAMIARCHAGPPAARVDTVECEETDPGPLVGSGFRQLPTA
jgi:acylphosphatase